MKSSVRWLAIFFAAMVLWAGFTDNPSVWPLRNTLEYHVSRAWWKIAGEPDRSRTGAVSGWVLALNAKPVADAVVVISEWDGRVRTARTNESGKYEISGVPAGFYRMAVSATGFAGMQSGGILRGVTIRPDRTAEASFRLKPAENLTPAVLPAPKFSGPEVMTCDKPVPGTSNRFILQFDSGDRTDPVFVYRPSESQRRPLPVLLTVYPGAVDTWECVSTGLAQAGYVVVAVGPPYSMDLAPDVDRLSALVAMIKRGDLPDTDSSRIAALGGSYSGLLLELLMQRDPGLQGVVLLGPPTEMFDFRRRYEREGFLPPFGLDRALVALGLPSREPLRYLENSMVFHVRPNLPPTLIFHSYQDEIVPYQQSRLLAESMRAQGVDAELHLFDGASHYLLEDGEASQVIYRRTVNFLRRHGMGPFPGKE